MVLLVLESVIGSSDVSDRFMKAIDECKDFVSKSVRKLLNKGPLTLIKERVD
jgi:hypothetical protein